MKPVLDGLVMIYPSMMKLRISTFYMLTIGSMQGRASVMVNELMTTGLKSSILGYMSSGDRVPDVMMTVWKRAKTGRMAIDESMQLGRNKCI